MTSQFSSFWRGTVTGEGGEEGERNCDWKGGGGGGGEGEGRGRGTVTGEGEGERNCDWEGGGGEEL